MTNTLKLGELREDDFRKTLPRYQKEHQQNNEQLANSFAELASKKGCSPAQLALSWVLSQGDNVIPIPGTKKRSKLKDNAGSVDISLSQQDLQDIEEVVKRYPDVGDRYSAANYKWADRN